MRIVYLLTRSAKPVGGHAVVVTHVKMLRAAGYNAQVHFCQDGPNSFYEPDLRLGEVAVDNPIQDRASILVIPEADLIVWADRVMRHAAENMARVWILNQNHFYTFNHRGNVAAEWVFDRANHFATSEATKQFLERMLRTGPVRKVPVCIDHTMFRPEKKIFRVACMPRKMPDEAGFIRYVATRLNPMLSRVQWLEIDGLRTPEVAAMLSNSALFLSLSRREGFGMPALEAMASGCIVVGFTGSGGDEYATPTNGVWVPEDDLFGVAAALARTVTDYANQAPYLSKMSGQARWDAMSYNDVSTKAALIELTTIWSGSMSELATAQ